MLDHTIFNERPECQDKMIQFLINMGYEYVSRSDAEKKRTHLSNVIFEDELVKFLNTQRYTHRNNQYAFSGESISKAVRALDVSLLQGLMMANYEIYHLLTLGISLEENIAIDSDTLDKRSFDLKYIDFENPQNNTWQVTEEFSVERPNGNHARPDIVLLVNGIPLVVIECKKSSINVKEGVNQNIRNMSPDYIPQLFKYSQLILSANPNKVVYGTCGSRPEYFVEWKEDEVEWQKNLCLKYSSNGEILEQDRVVVSLLDKSRLLDIIRNFILFDSGIKKVARHQQFFAIHKAMDRINGKDIGKTKTDNTNGGVIWHTQGSGKSLTMVMLVKKIQQEKSKESPRFIIVTDRVDLDKQIKNNFNNTAMSPVRANTGKGLGVLLADKSKVIITTLINKFENAYKNKSLNVESEKFYVFIDEAHRSQYKSLYVYMRQTLPNAVMIAFTGTPLIASSKKNTYQRFGDPIHNYTMNSSIEDKITVPLVYEGRKISQSNPKEIIDNYFNMQTANLTDEQREELKNEYSRFYHLAQVESRISLIAFDIIQHYTTYIAPKGLKGMIVCSSRATAIDIHNFITKSDTNKILKPKVVITFDKKEGDTDDISDSAIKKIDEYRKTHVQPNYGDNIAKYDEYVCGDFINPDGDTNILIVKDKLLTGFDAPIAGVLYLDKSVKEHNLLQAIARVNRVHPSKDYGLIVDYWGVFGHLNDAIDIYNDAESGFNKFDRNDIENVINNPIEEQQKISLSHQKLWGMFEGLTPNSTTNLWQECLQPESTRKEFYEKLKTFANLLNLAQTSSTIFEVIGIKKIEEYKKDYIFFNKLRHSVIVRFDDHLDKYQYEQGIKALLSSFVHSEDIKIVVEPVSIMDTKKMEQLLSELGSDVSRADAIKTRMEKVLQATRYKDPMRFEEFSKKIKTTLDEYNLNRDAESYFNKMESIADDFRNGNLTQNYPNSIANNSNAKAFYGAIITILKEKQFIINMTQKIEEQFAELSTRIQEEIANKTKRDWRYNEIAHKEIKSYLDDRLFEMFESINIEITKENIDIIDLLIEELLKVTLERY